VTVVPAAAARSPAPPLDECAPVIEGKWVLRRRQQQQVREARTVCVQRQQRPGTLARSSAIGYVHSSSFTYDVAVRNLRPNRKGMCAEQPNPIEIRHGRAVVRGTRPYFVLKSPS
jgi:hypothetical protein